jgi:urease accessory protein
MRRERSPGPTSAATLLQLMWLASPALPVGGFSYSEGLESACEAGLVSTEAQAARWLTDQLQLSLARFDMPLLARALALWSQPEPDAEALQALNAQMLQTRESAEFRQQTEQTGRSLAVWLKLRLATDDARLLLLQNLPRAPSWPLAFALAASVIGAPAREALLAFAFSWAENQVQAAIKAVPLGQSAGQRILMSLTAAISVAVDDALRRPAAQCQTFTPMLAILSAQHEAQYSRIFRS